MAASKLHAWAALWSLITRVDTGKLAPWLGLRNAIGVSLPLAAGVAMGATPAGLVMATGALNVSFSDSSEPYGVRAWRMSAASVLVGFAVAIGEICGHHPVLAVAITTGWAFGAGMLVALGTTAADLGAVSLVTMVVYASVPAPPERALLAGLLAVGGGLLQTSLSLALWTVRRYVPERRAIANLYLELARSAAEPIHATSAPLASGQTTQAGQMLATIDRDRTVEGERLRALLSQAERMRLNLMMLGRLRIRIRRETEDGPERSELDPFFDVAARTLETIGRALLTDKSPVVDSSWSDTLQQLTHQLREGCRGRPEPLAALASDARRQMDALAGQLRSAMDLAAHVTPQGREQFERGEARQPWQLRLIGTFATLRANLSLESAAFRHAVRLAVCVATAYALARNLHLGRAYWLPMTVAIVLKPDFSATFSRGVLRLVGTFTGLALATIIFHLLPAATGLEVVLIAIFMFVVRWLGPANYGIFVVAITALVVLLVALSGVAPKDVMAARAWNTAMGGAIALVAYWLWPTWERTQVAETVARLLDAYRDYFRVVRDSLIQLDRSFAPELDRVRQAARLARSNLEASVDRLAAEPGTTPERLAVLNGVLANSHRLVHAIMALEAGLATSRPVPARATFPAFANATELSLYYLAGALRGDAITVSDLPDVREAQLALVASAHSPADRYALVNVETDRITNSVDTLSEEILGWLRK